MPAERRRFEADRTLMVEKGALPTIAHPADRDGRAVLAPVDPVELLLRHRGEVERLRTAVGSKLLFETHVLPMLFAWAAVVQSMPRDARGLWSGADGFFEAGLQFARGSLNAVDARVLEPSMAPTKRARWTDRIRMAAVAAGLLSDAERLAGLRLEAGTVDPETDDFHHLETHAVGEETALAFGVRHAGRWFRLTRHTAIERAGRLPTLGLDLMRLVVPADTLLWMGDFERTSGETVLSALKAAVMFGTGKTEAERLIAESVARGREWAVNRRAWLAARREGKSPLLEGFGEVFRLALLTRIERHLWVFNRDDSPLTWAEDGLYLRWPEGFVETIEAAGEGSVFREVPDEPDVAAQILMAAGVIEPDPTGEAVWWSEEQEPLKARKRGEPVLNPAEEEKPNPLVRTAWVKLTNEAKIVNLAKREAVRRGESLPQRRRALMRQPVERLTTKWDVIPGRFTWRLALPPLKPAFATPKRCKPAPTIVSDGRLALERAVARINGRVDAPLFGSARGLFVPDGVLDERFRWDTDDLKDVFVLIRQSPGSILPAARVSAVHRVRLRGTDAERLADLTPEGRPDKDGNVLLEGVLIHPFFVKPYEVWTDGTEEERPFPETTGRLEWIEGADYVGADKWRTDETARAIEGRKLEAAREIERKAAQKRESNRRSREKRKAKEAGRKTQKTGKRTEAGKA